MRRAVSCPSGRSSTSRFACRGARGPAVRSSASTRSSSASRSSATSWTSPEAEGDLCVEALARDEVAARGALADPAQRERRDHRGDDPELDLGEGEDRPGLGDRYVAAGDEPDAAAERMAVDEGDDRRRARVDGLEHASQRDGVGDVRLEIEVDRGAHPLDVGPRAEARPVAGQHDRARRAHVDERLRQLRDESRVEGVPRPRPRQRHAQDVAVPRDAERTHGRQPKVSPMAGKRFTAELEGVQKTATMLCVPFDHTSGVYVDRIAQRSQR